MKYKLIDDGFQFRLSPEGRIINDRDVIRFLKTSFKTKEDVIDWVEGNPYINKEDIINI